MATISFSKAIKPAPAATPPTPEPVAKASEMAVATTVSAAVATLAQSPQLQGEFTQRDMAIPFLQLGQKAGMLCDEHPEWIGQWVYDKAVPLGNSVKVVVCRLKKRYEEVTEYGSQEMPQQFETFAAAQAAGVEVRDVAEIDLLIETDDVELEPFAMLDNAGKFYMPARYVVRSTAYGKTVGIFLKDLAGWLKNDLAAGFYSMESIKKTANQNTWFAPQLAVAGKVPAELRTQIGEKFGV
jgi:hypothetical protein